MEIASFEKFLVDKIKVQGKTGEHALLLSLSLALPLLLQLPAWCLVPAVVRAPCTCQCCSALFAAHAPMHTSASAGGRPAGRWRHGSSAWSDEGNEQRSSSWPVEHSDSQV